MQFKYNFVSFVFGMSPFDQNPEDQDPIITINNFVEWTATTILFLRMSSPFGFIGKFLECFEERGILPYAIKMTIEQLSREYNYKYADGPEDYDFYTPMVGDDYSMKKLYQNIIDLIEEDYKEQEWKEGEIEKVEKFLKELKTLV